MSKKILVVSQYFYPEQFRINDICEEWVNRGYDVTVLSAIPNYPAGKFYDGYSLFQNRKEDYKGIKIKRLPVIPRGNNAIMLGLNYLSFVISGFFWKMFTREKADLVYIYEVSPMTLALPGIWFSQRKKVPCHLYVTDLWPENVEMMTKKNHKFLIKILSKMVDYIYRNCTKIYTASNSFKKAIIARGIDEDKVEYWPQYAEDFYVKKQKEIKNCKTTFLFAGNIGEAQGLGILPKVAKIMKDEDISCEFKIIGDGRYKETLVSTVKKEKLDSYFTFHDKVPAVKISEEMSKVDAALIILQENEVFKMTIPAKTQSCMACGVPILLSASGEVQNIISDADCGYVSDAGDVITLARNIKEFMSLKVEDQVELGHNALEYSDIHFNKKKLLDQMDQWFKEE